MSGALPSGLRVELERAYGVEFSPATGQLRGEESAGWLVHSSAGEMFIQLYPSWRTVGEIEWCYQVARAAAAEAPEVVLPLVVSDGSTALATQAGPVAVFPFAAGTPLDTESETLRIAAAELLAQFSQNDRGDDLVDERASAFLTAYLRAGGPVPARELRHLVPFIRRRLRQEVGRERLAAAQGGPFDPEYANSEIRAFKTLRERTIDLVA